MSEEKQIVSAWRVVRAGVFIIIAGLMFGPLFGQSYQTGKDSTLERISLDDGTILIGFVSNEGGDSLHIVTSSGLQLDVDKTRIRKREKLRGQMVRGHFWRDDPNQSRLFFGPTARPLKPGEGYFSIYEIFFPFLAVGVTDFLSVGGGVTLLPGASSQAVYFAPKIIPISVKGFSLAAGALYIAIPENERDAGITYGVGTVGNPNASLSFGLGWGFSGEDFADKPIVYLGGETRTSAVTKIITENWFIPDSDVDFVSLGIRIFGEHLAADLALVHPLGADLDGFPFFPLVGFAYNFGPSSK